MHKIKNTKEELWMHTYSNLITFFRMNWIPSSKNGRHQLSLDNFGVESDEKQQRQTNRSIYLWPLLVASLLCLLPHTDMFSPSTSTSSSKRHGLPRCSFINDHDSKRCKTSCAAVAAPNTPLCMEQLPEELLKKILCDYVSSISDRFNLLTTNKKFNKICHSKKMKQVAKLMIPAPPKHNQNYASFSLRFIIQPVDTTSTVVQRLLPYAKEDNQDGILILGWLATYGEFLFYLFVKNLC